MKNTSLVSTIRIHYYLSVVVWLLLSAKTLFAELPPDAQEAFDDGVSAANSQDWTRAIDYFQKARINAPEAPIILLNLGLAESQIPGRELRAICWLSAYLTADTNAPEAATVKSQIHEFFVQNQINVDRVIKSVEDAVSHIPEGTHNEFFFTTDKQSDLEEVAALWAESGDIANAQKTSGLIKDRGLKTSALKEIAEAQMEADDIAGANRTLLAAHQSADRIKDGSKCLSLVDIAKDQIKIGDIADANATLLDAKNAADLFTNGFTYRELEASVSDAQADARSTDNSPIANQAPIQPAVSDWLDKLNDDDSVWVNHLSGNDCPLNTSPFLDSASYLKSLPPSDYPQTLVKTLFRAAEKLVRAQNVIGQMLKQRPVRVFPAESA